MPLWKLNFIPFGLAQVPIWVLAEDQALERPRIAPTAVVPARASAELPVAAVVPAMPVPEDVDPAPLPRPDGFKRFVDRFVGALVRFGDRSYEAKVRSGRLNRYYY
jgi:hypothetical protein